MVAFSFVVDRSLDPAAFSLCQAVLVRQELQKCFSRSGCGRRLEQLDSCIAIVVLSIENVLQSFPKMRIRRLV